MANTCGSPESQTKFISDACCFEYAPNMSIINFVHAIHCHAISTRNSLMYRWQNKINIPNKHTWHMLDILYDNVIKVYIT